MEARLLIRVSPRKIRVVRGPGTGPLTYLTTLTLTVASLETAP